MTLMSFGSVWSNIEPLSQASMYMTCRGRCRYRWHIDQSTNISIQLIVTSKPVNVKIGWLNKTCIRHIERMNSSLIWCIDRIIDESINPSTLTILWYFFVSYIFQMVLLSCATWSTESGKAINPGAPWSAKLTNTWSFGPDAMTLKWRNGLYGQISLKKNYHLKTATFAFPWGLDACTHEKGM